MSKICVLGQGYIGLPTNRLFVNSFREELPTQLWGGSKVQTTTDFRIKRYSSGYTKETYSIFGTNPVISPLTTF